jgi:hypothetical protein
VVVAAQEHRRLRVLINDCKLVEVKDDLVVLAVSEALVTSARASERDLCDLLARAWDRAVRLEIQSDAPAGAPVPAAVAPAVNPQAARAAIADHPLVKQAMEAFRARLVGVQPRRPQPTDAPP